MMTKDILKVENGIHVQPVSETRVDIEGRLDGYSPVRVIVEYQREPIFQVVSVPHLNLEKARLLAELLDRAVDAVQMTQREMERAHDDVQGAEAVAGEAGLRGCGA